MADSSDFEVVSSPANDFEVVSHPSSSKVKSDFEPVDNDFEVVSTPQQKTSLVGSVAGEAARNVVPLAAAHIATKIAAPTTRALGARAGAIAGAEIGALIPGLGETGISEGIGGVIGGLVGYITPGFLAASGSKAVQTKIADTVAPDSVLGSKVEREQESEHPIATTVTGLLTLGRPNPLKFVRAGRTIASTEGRQAMTSLLKTGNDADAVAAWKANTSPYLQKSVGDVLDVAQAGGINAAFNIANQIESGHYSATDLMKAAAEGSLFNEPWMHSAHPEAKVVDESLKPKTESENPDAIDKVQNEGSVSEQPQGVDEERKKDKIPIPRDSIPSPSGQPAEGSEPAKTLSPESLNPALLIDGKPITGADSHAKIAKLNGVEGLDALAVPENHVFVDDAGNVYSRAEASKAIGETEPLQSYRLADLKSQSQPIDPTKEPIHAAVRTENGDIFTGNSLEHIYAERPKTKGEEGFILPDGRFINQEQAKAAFGKENSQEFGFGKDAEEAYKQSVEVGYPTRKTFISDYIKNRDKEIGETEDEFLMRRHCSETVPAGGVQ